MCSDTETKEGREKEKCVEAMVRDAGRAHAEGPQCVQRSSRKRHLLRAKGESQWWNLGRKHEMATVRNRQKSGRESTRNE